MEVIDLTDIWTRKSEETAGPETKQFPALLSIKSVDENNRRITALASTGNVDRDNEIILPEAFKESLSIFMKNPVVLAAHQHRLSDGRSPVVANVVQAQITKEGLLVVIEFHCLTELGREYWELYRNKKQRALSVGIIPQEHKNEMVGTRTVLIHTLVEWLELSLVPVPSNRESLTRAKQRKLDFVNGKRQEQEDEKMLDEIRAENPDFDAECMEFAEMIYSFGDEETLDDVDLVGLVKGL